MRFIPAVSLVQIQLQPPMARWSSGLRHRPFTAVTRVRISSGSPLEKRVANMRPFTFNLICRNDGIGRRARLKIWSWRQGAGSSPASGTKRKSVLVRGRIFVCIIHSSIFIIHYSLKEIGFSNE